MNFKLNHLLYLFNYFYPFFHNDDEITQIFNYRSRNALLDGDTQNYDWDSGYTCHQLNSGLIQIQLGQPYIIDSMR